MKITIPSLLFAMLIPAIAATQTYKAECDYLNGLLKSGEKTPQEVGQMKKDLDNACNGSKTYPVLPYDTLTGIFHFSYILDCAGISKKVLFERVKEWCSLSYADIDAVLRYEDFESGKIIIKGYAPLAYRQSYRGLFGQKRTYSQSSKGYHTTIVTIKEGRVKMEVQDIRFSFISRPYWSSTTNSYLAGGDTEVYLNQIFPITKNESTNDWPGLLDLANQAVIVYNLHSAALNYYLHDWEKDYKF